MAEKIYETLKQNPSLLLQNKALPFILPDFGVFKPAELYEAIMQAINAQSLAWENIASCKEAPNKANVLEALEKSDGDLDFFLNILETMVSAIGGQEWEEIERKLAAPLAAHRQEFLLNSKLYQRISELCELPLDEESTYFAKKLKQDFELAGVTLQPDQHKLLIALCEEISTLETEFSQKTVAALSEGAKDLADLGISTLENTTIQNALTKHSDYLERRRIYLASINRANGSNEKTDTRELVCKIASLRARKAQLLGVESHAELVAKSQTARSARTVAALMARIGEAAKKTAKREGKALRDMAIAKDPGHCFSSADWSYWEEIKRKREFGFDDEELKPYLELDSVINNGIFYAAKKLFSIDFKERKDLKAWHEDARIWQIFDTDGSDLGLFIADYYARPGKTGGAWMHEITMPSLLRATLPVVGNNLNITKPEEGPTLLTWDQVVTVFHEFGHALHALFSKAYYPSLSGTNVPRDFVEFPSQLNEIWAYHPQVIANFAKHIETGMALSLEQIKALSSSATYGQGFATLEYVSAACLDLAWHAVTEEHIPEADKCSDFEAKALKAWNLDYELIMPRYRSTYFSHTFGGGYDAGYYSYMWAEVLVATAQRWFQSQENEGLNFKAGSRYRNEILSRGETRHPLESFKALTNSNPDPDDLIRRRGLNTF